MKWARLLVAPAAALALLANSGHADDEYDPHEVRAAFAAERIDFLGTLNEPGARDPLVVTLVPQGDPVMPGFELTIWAGAADARRTEALFARFGGETRRHGNVLVSVEDRAIASVVERALRRLWSRSSRHKQGFYELKVG